MAERLNAPVLKTGIRKRIGGSNPSSSAFFVVCPTNCGVGRFYHSFFNSYRYFYNLFWDYLSSTLGLMSTNFIYKPYPMRKSLFFIALISLFALVEIRAQRPEGRRPGGASSGIVGTLKGSIIDSTTNTPVEFATITVKPSGKEDVVNGTITDESGNFKMTEIPVNTYDIIINFLGYTEKKISGVEMTLKKPDVDLGNIMLYPDNLVLSEVEVTAQRSSVENKVDRMVFNTNNDPTLQGGDGADVLRKVPMLSVDLDGNVSVRGSSNIRVLVNGKPSGLFSASIADALKMLPADQIESVEVITTPSAKYDAEGTGGIINIITKKKNIDGFAGSVGGTIGTRSNRGNLSLNFAKGRFGLNGQMGMFYGWPLEGNSDFLNQRFRDGVLISEAKSDGTTTSSHLGARGQIGAFYDFNAFNSINTSVNFRGFGRSNDGTSNASRTVQELSHLVYTTATEGSGSRRGFDWSTDYTHKFNTEGQELTAAVQLNQDVNTDETDIDWTGDIIDATRADNTGTSNEWTYLLDYTDPITESLKLEVGGKAIIRDILSDYDFTRRDDSGVFVLDPSRTRDYTYDQDVYAGYVNTTWTITKDWSAVAGLRYENTAIEFDNPVSESSDRYDNTYANFVPSVILSRKFGFTTVKGSYNRRIERPSLRNINPYRQENDDKVVQVGNPFLKPELSDQFEIGVSSFLSGTVINFSTFYRKTKDVISSYAYLDENNYSVSTYDNLGTGTDIGINLYTSGTIKEKLTLRANVDLYNRELNGSEDLFGDDNTANFWNYNLFGSATWSLPKDWKIEVFGVYHSPRQSIQTKRTGFSMISFGFNKELWDKRATLGLNVTNPFNKYQTWDTVRESDDLYFESTYQRIFRSVGLNFNYRFGKLDFNPQKSRRRSKINNNDQGSDQGGQEQQ